MGSPMLKKKRLKSLNLVQRPPLPPRRGLGRDKYNEAIMMELELEDDRSIQAFNNMLIQKNKEA